MSINENLKAIKEKIEATKRKKGIDTHVQIVAATKNHPQVTINKCINAGILCIGENRIQEAEKKFKDIEHSGKIKKRFIGHLQSNKISKCLKLFNTIDSVDTFNLSRKISWAAKNKSNPIPVLLEINTHKEKKKYGFYPEETEEMLRCFEQKNIKIEGLMTVAPRTKDKKIVRSAFRLLRKTMHELNKSKPGHYPPLSELSMGMSNDFKIAIEEGSTQNRIGTALLGERPQG